jgi:hypothetical protein
MSDRSRYVFGAALAGVALSGAAGIVERANAAPVTNAAFTFESSFSGVTSTVTSTAGTTAAVTAASFGPLLAESGTGSAYGVHTSAATVYSVPAGNGSQHAFSANTWGVGDYYQFSVPTTGIQGIVLNFDQTGSATGPAHYTLTASADGTNFTTVAGYTVAFSFTVTSTNTAGSTTAGGFSTGTSNPLYSQMFDLSAMTALDNNSNAVFRLVDADTTSINGGTVATAGTDRIDNFVVSGSVSGTPEPTALSLAGIAALGMLGRRKRQA